jgi:hypothetical protein
MVVLALSAVVAASGVSERCNENKVTALSLSIACWGRSEARARAAWGLQAGLGILAGASSFANPRRAMSPEVHRCIAASRSYDDVRCTFHLKCRRATPCYVLPQ